MLRFFLISENFRVLLSQLIQVTIHHIKRNNQNFNIIVLSCVSVKHFVLSELSLSLSCFYFVNSLSRTVHSLTSFRASNNRPSYILAWPKKTSSVCEVSKSYLLTAVFSINSRAGFAISRFMVLPNATL